MSRGKMEGRQIIGDSGYGDDLCFADIQSHNNDFEEYKLAGNRKNGSRIFRTKTAYKRSRKVQPLPKTSLRDKAPRH